MRFKTQAIVVIWALLQTTTLSATMTRVHPIKEAILYASKASGVPARLIYGICYAESNLNPRAIVKHDGNGHSYGMCQIKFKTAQGVGFTGAAKDLFNPRVNALYAARYIKYHLAKNNNDWVSAISSYNRGHLEKPLCNVPYIKRVLKYAVRFK